MQLLAFRRLIAVTGRTKLFRSWRLFAFGMNLIILKKRMLLLIIGIHLLLIYFYFISRSCLLIVYYGCFDRLFIGVLLFDVFAFSFWKDFVIDGLLYLLRSRMLF